MHEKLPEPYEQAMLYDDAELYACLANYPITKGHSVVVWKQPVTDLHLLTREQYEHLMDVVDDVRTALLSVLNVEKVYLLYMDEVNQVHWHLIPRYNEQGFNVFEHAPSKLEDFSLAPIIREVLLKKYR